MALYLLRRFLALVAVLVVMSFIVFCLQRIVPADPARAIAGPTAPAATVEQVREKLGLNDPILVQYGRFLEGLVHGDLGTSTRTRKPVGAPETAAARRNDDVTSPSLPMRTGKTAVERLATGAVWSWVAPGVSR